MSEGSIPDADGNNSNHPANKAVSAFCSTERLVVKRHEYYSGFMSCRYITKGNREV